MIRKIIQINEDKCNGCGLCAEACHEDAIGIVDGKAKLLRDDYCDGLGNCLPVCPTDAISFIEREAAAFDEEAVLHNQMKKIQKEGAVLNQGCPGSRSREINRADKAQQSSTAAIPSSQLRQWPVQIKLVPVNATYFEDSSLLIAADCTAYAYANFHNEFIRNKVTLIGCPKLDEVDYTEKLTAIISQNNIKSLTIVRMEVPCCGGIEHAAKNALQASGKFIPWQVVTISTDGYILN